jgi:hypothetical protein
VADRFPWRVGRGVRGHPFQRSGRRLSRATAVRILPAAVCASIGLSLSQAIRPSLSAWHRATHASGALFRERARVSALDAREAHQLATPLPADAPLRQVQRAPPPRSSPRLPGTTRGAPGVPGGHRAASPRAPLRVYVRSGRATPAGSQSARAQRPCVMSRTATKQTDATLLRSSTRRSLTLVNVVRCLQPRASAAFGFEKIWRGRRRFVWRSHDRGYRNPWPPRG